MKNIALVLSGVLAFAGQVCAQEPDLTARDIFYSAADLVGKKPQNVKSSSGAVKTPPAHRSEPLPSASSGGGTTIKVAAPLGLRYAVLKRASARQYQEVSADTTFHAGDKIRLSVMSNEKGYLYIVQQGSSGTWSPLFPSPDINAGRNIVEAGHSYEIPSGPGEGFLMDDNAGEEKIFIMLTRQPESDLEKVVMSLRQGVAGANGRHETAQTRPINDEMLEHLRQQIQPRDLVFTKVDDEDDKEKAVYVVNTGASSKPDSRVVVDLKLNHR